MRMGALPPVEGPMPISLASPSPMRSSTTSETVVRVSPVARATSARLSGPCSYTMRSTSRWLERRVC